MTDDESLKPLDYGLYTLLVLNILVLPYINCLIVNFTTNLADYRLELILIIAKRFRLTFFIKFL